MGEAVRIAQAPGITRYVFRGGDAAVARAFELFGVELPRTPLRAASAGERHALWLGPDEWLLIAPPATELASISEPHALVDVSHRNVGFTVEGSRAALVLNSGCPLDLDEAAFPVGMCTRTIFDKAEIVLWRTAPDVFRVEVWRSFGPYVEALLREAAEEAAV